MRNLLLAGLLLGSVLGCGKKDPFDAALDEIGTIKDKMCACKDKDCAEKVDKEFEAWRDGLKDKIGDSKPNADQDKKGEDIRAAMRKCQESLK
jgi:hypothetical protein